MTTWIFCNAYSRIFTTNVKHSSEFVLAIGKSRFRSLGLSGGASKRTTRRWVHHSMLSRNAQAHKARACGALFWISNSDCQHQTL